MKKKYGLAFILAGIFLFSLIFAEIVVMGKKTRLFDLILQEIDNLDGGENTLKADILAEIKAQGITKYYELDNSWASGRVFCAHAGGDAGGELYTNSKEAFLESYSEGYRVFEIDLTLTDDGQLVACHDANTWRKIAGYATEENPSAGPAYTHQNFMASSLYDVYTPLDCKALLKLLKKYPDAYLITDTKSTDLTTVYKQFSALVACAKEVDEDLLERIIPQVYTQEMFYTVMDIYPFPSAILALYMAPWTVEQVETFVAVTGVNFVSMWAGTETDTPEFTRLIHGYGVKTGIYILNSEAEAAAAFARGHDIVYSDIINPKQYLQNEK